MFIIYDGYIHLYLMGGDIRMLIFDIFRASKIKAENERLKGVIKELESSKEELQNKLDDLNGMEYYQIQDRIIRFKDEITNLEVSKKELINKLEKEEYDLILKLEKDKSEIVDKIQELNNEEEKLTKNVNTQTRKVARIKELYSSIEHAINNFFVEDLPSNVYKIPENDLTELEATSPSIVLKLHSMGIKDLRKAYNENNKLIDKVLSEYASRYTTKANKAIYQLMVIALRAELQNVLYNLKYEKLDKSLEDLKKITNKYLKIAGDGNQSIAGTLTKFIGEIEYLFMNAIKIEYNYYVKKEQAKQEQLAIRQQMREEAEERKLLAQQQKKIEKEEEKYSKEIEKINNIISLETDETKIQDLNAKILELQVQLSDVIIKKDEVSKLQNGKAGNVYIISNLGSFGENVFKIGMTRRLDPQARIDELGNASVPFRFDVHSFIFSDDAVELEKQLHITLNDKRVNKVNLRKEFFNVTIDELETLVTEIEPTAEFTKTMIAEEFRQSLSSDEVYDNSGINYFDEDDEE